MNKTKFEAKLRELETVAAVSSMAVENLLGNYEGPEASRVHGNYANLLRYTVADVERRVKALRAPSSSADQRDPRETPLVP